MGSIVCFVGAAVTMLVALLVFFVTLLVLTGPREEDDG